LAVDEIGGIQPAPYAE